MAVLAGLAASGLLSTCSSDGNTGRPPPPATFPNRRTAFSPDGRLLGYVANRNSDTVSVLDLDAMATLGTVPVGRNPVDIDGPRHIVLAPAAGLAYVVVSYPMDFVSPHTAAAGTTQRAGYLLALSLDDLRPLGELRLEPRSEDVSLSADAQQLSVSHNDLLRSIQPDLEQRRASLALVRPAEALVGGTPDVRRVTVCVAPTSSVFSPDGTRAYVACSGEDVLAVVDTQRAAVLARVPTGEAAVNQPYAIVADARGERLAVSNRRSHTVALFSAGDLPVLLSTFPVTGIPSFAGWSSDDELLVPMQEPAGVALIDTSGGQPARERLFETTGDAACDNPSEAQRAPDGRLFVVCEGDHYDNPGAVVQLDAETLEVIARVPVGSYSDRMALRR